MELTYHRYKLLNKIYSHRASAAINWYALQLSLNGDGDDEQNVFDTLLIIKIIQSFYENF